MIKVLTIARWMYAAFFFLIGAHSLLGLFAWQFRDAYQPMWNYQNESKMNE